METKINSAEKFMRDMQSMFAEYHIKQHSENIKRGIAAKKQRILSTSKVNVNHCKVL